MVSEEVKYRIGRKIMCRYDRQSMYSGGPEGYSCRGWTPAQKRRMRKNLRKYDIAIPSVIRGDK